MTDRVIVVDGALPQTTDILSTNMYATISMAYENLAILGSGTFVAGLACLPTTPSPTLQVIVQPGSIFALDPTDATAYGDLGTNATNIMKQGLLQAPVTLNLTPPSTVGFSQVYLIEVALEDIDTGATVLSFYNSAVPTAPFSGPANSGQSTFTTRTCQAVISMVAGTAASTGTQVTPTTTPGFTPLYTITLVNGQTQINSAAIVQLISAPFFPTLPSIPMNVLEGTWVWGTDSGVANAYVVTLGNVAEPITAYGTGGLGIRFKAQHNNSGSAGSTINVIANGLNLGTVNILRAGGATLVSGDIVSGQVLDLTYDGVSFQMANYLGVSAGTTNNNFSTLSIPYVPDTGTQNNLIGNYSPAILTLTAGLFIAIKLAHAITGGTVINVNGLGNKTVDLGNLTPTPTGVFVTGEILLMVYDGTEFQIVTSSSGSGGATGATGATGAQGVPGPPGTIPLTPGAIGSFATWCSGFSPATTGWAANCGYGAMLAPVPSEYSGGPGFGAFYGTSADPAGGAVGQWFYTGSWQTISYSGPLGAGFGSVNPTIPAATLGQRIA